MTRAELLAAGESARADGRGRARRGHPGAGLLEPRRGRRARSSSACGASARTATTSRPTPWSAGPPRWCASARSGWVCRRCWWTTRAPRWARPRRASSATRPPSCAWSASPVPTARPPPPSWRAHLLEEGGHADGPARHGQAGGGRHGGGGGAHHARGDRPPGHLPPHARRRRPRLRDGGVLARARAGARDRDPVRLQGVHEPHPGPSRFPRDDGRLLRGQAAAVRRAAGRPS